MANLSSLTRKEQVLAHLQDHRGQWVNGTDLATAEIGGSEGLKRLRELRAEGQPIERRQHPDRSRDIFQYRLLTDEQIRQSEFPDDIRNRFVQTTWLDDSDTPQDPDELVAAWLG